jgi:hypothetical protein
MVRIEVNGVYYFIDEEEWKRLKDWRYDKESFS